MVASLFSQLLLGLSGELFCDFKRQAAKTQEIRNFESLLPIHLGHIG